MKFKNFVMKNPLFVGFMAFCLTVVFCVVSILCTTPKDVNKQVPCTVSDNSSNKHIIVVFESDTCDKYDIKHEDATVVMEYSQDVEKILNSVEFGDTIKADIRIDENREILEIINLRY